MTTPKPAARPKHPEMFAALEVPNFRRYVSGQSLSLIGTWVETVAQALLVLRLTHSGVVPGVDYRGQVRADPAGCVSLRRAPGATVTPNYACCWSRRRASLWSRPSSARSYWRGDIRIWQVVVLAVLFGMLSAVHNPARQAFVQEVVGHDLVRNAVTLNTLAR